MPARRYNLEYNVNGGPWLLGRADEAPGPGKSLEITGLDSGTYAVKLRLVPLSGDPTPIVSNEAIMQVGSPSIAEPVLVTATSDVTLLDVVQRRDTLLAAAGVVVSEADTLAMNEALLIAAGVSATVVDTYRTAQQEVPTSYADVTATVTAVQIMLEQIQAAISASVTAADGLVMREAVNVVSSVAATVADTYTAAPTAPTQPVISASGGDTTVTIALASGGTGATSYDLKWGTSAGSRPNTITGVTLPYTHTGRTNGTTYYYSLVATNAQGSTESAEVSAAAVVYVPGTPVTLNFESSTITDSNGATWEKVISTAVVDGGVGVITSGVAGISGADGNCLLIKQSTFDDGSDYYNFDTFIRRTMNVAAGTLSIRVMRGNTGAAGTAYVKIGSTKYDLGLTTINTFVNKTITIPSSQSNVVVEIGFQIGTAYVDAFIDSVSIPQ